MKKILLCMTLLILGFAGKVFADSSIQNPVGTFPEASSNASVVSVEKIINSGADIDSLISQKAIEGVDILPETTTQDYRICSFCWLFAAILGGLLYEYGQKLRKMKKKKPPKDWYQKPILYAVVIYFAHAIIHPFFASTIFLDYYWMILFDELIAAFLYYHYIFMKKKLPKKMIQKTI